ncbi:hypothetical protein ACHWQZ_G015122 [Mnemiopsis leidyi]
MSRTSLLVVFPFFVFLLAFSSAEDLKIALLFTEESPYTELAFNEAIREINSNDKMLPETRIEGVAMSIGSEADNPANSTYKMCRLLTENDIVAIVGPFSSSHVRECSFLAGQMGLPLISPTVSDPYLLNRHWSPTLARLSPTNKVQAVALADLIQHFKWKRVSIVYNNDPYGLTLREAVKEELLSRELTVVTEVRIEHNMVRRLIYPSMTKGWIEQLVNSSSRVSLLLVQPDFADIILEAAAEHNMIDSVYAWIASTAVTQSFLNAYAEGGRIKPHYDGMVGLSPYLETEGEIYTKLNRIYQKNELKLTPTDALVYDSVYLIAHGLDELYRKNPGIEIVNFEGDCYQDKATYAWTLGAEIYAKFTTTKYKGITGHSQMWPNHHPDRDSYRYNIVNFNRRLFQSDSVSTIGSWDPKNQPSISMRKPPIWTHGQKSVPTDNPMITDVVLRLGVLEDKPFIIYNYTNYGYPNCSSMPNKDWCYEGVSIDIIRHLQKKLNFKYEFIESPDGKFGNEVNGVWNGLISEISGKRLDIGVVGFGTSHSREKVVNFGISFYPGGVRMATSKDISTTDYFFFLRPFSRNVWISILCGIVFFFVVVYFLDRFSPYGNDGGIRFKSKQCRCENCSKLLKRGGFRDYVCPFKEDHELKHEMAINLSAIMSAPNALWLSICSFLAVAPADGIPKNWSGRMMITIWWMICLVMVSMYTANLAAFLTVASKGVDISSVEDLLNQEEYAFGTVEGSITENLLLNSDNSKLRKVYDKSASTVSYKEGVTRMKLGKYIFLYGNGPLDLTTSDNCNLETIGDVLVDFGYAFAFQIDSPYIEVFNREMLIMQERGMIKDLWHKYVKGHCDEDDDFDAEADSLEVINLLGILILCVPLLVVAAFVFLLEILASPKKRDGKRMDMGDAIQTVFDDNHETRSDHTCQPLTKPGDNLDFTYEVPRPGSSLEYVSPDFDQSVYEREAHWTQSQNPTLTETANSVQTHVAILTDASISGWGATNLSTKKSVRGYWREEERSLPQHILELKAVYLALKIYCKFQNNVHVQVNLDEQDVVDVINGDETKKASAPVSFLKRKIWELVLQFNITLTAQYIDGAKSITANTQSRLPVDNTDWTISNEVYETICNHFAVEPEIDLFASWITTKCPLFVSKMDDPKSFAVNAFKQNWDSWDCVYCFPPISDSMLSKVAARVSQAACKILLVVPRWTRSNWYLELLKHKVGEPYPLGREAELYHPHDRSMSHPHGARLKLVAILCRPGGRSQGGFVPEGQTDSFVTGGTLPPQHPQGSSRGRAPDANVAINDISGNEFLNRR